MLKVLPGVSQWPLPVSKPMLPKPRRYSSQRRPKSTLPSSLLWMRSHPGKIEEVLLKTLWPPSFMSFIIKTNSVTLILCFILTSVLAGLITEDLVWRVEGVGLDHVHLGVSSSTTVDLLTLLTCITQENNSTEENYRTYRFVWKIHLYILYGPKIRHFSSRCDQFKGIPRTGLVFLLVLIKEAWSLNLAIAIIITSYLASIL